MSQRRVNNRYVNDQLKRQVFIYWPNKKRKFKPRWYFWLFHNKYRKGPDRRNIWQLLPTVAFTTLNEQDSELEGEDVDVWYKQEVNKGLDRTLNKRWNIYEKKKFGEINVKIATQLEKSTSLNANTGFIFKVLNEQERINGDVKVIRDSYMDDAEKGEAYQNYLKELKTLSASIYNYNKALNLKETYLPAITKN